MGRMSQWVLHRAKVLGMPTAGALADESGIAIETVHAMLEADSLQHIGRSARAYLARALKVSVRDLESLDAGGAKWIAVTHHVDLDRHAPKTARSRSAAMPAAVPCPAGRGVPILGRVMKGGAVEHFDDWTPLDGRRLRVRYAGVPDCFALELKTNAPPHQKGTFLAFQIIAPADLQAGDLALLTRSDASAETRLCRIEQIEASTLRLLPPANTQSTLPPVALCDILRAARIIGAHT
ncbi:MAG: hypothetical protein JWM97_1040 [Phycisphaerales bacterium]|nr:hypothetical protein [Phycisphaerales bacterium]